ncbi:5'-methylthioadenosine/adenosylhomocysteine nucleosidase [Caldimonas caldifontis]|uniref:5'-methylthioadenosine/adenosylhomocysteine nucleosidase n=1 Tax=Caldimonas caldifontis TaxID=1452508 RepID=A0A2S5SX97_9BURK|nr:5'-methylthioadenosine/adenosylhomocysteine nucleosidase [Caldimonas caldifontis]PPE67259.1 5'-methylthioadenosine/adenosylhomocysteine nucleosidase [Caldimonas caldifontis]
MTLAIIAAMHEELSAVLDLMPDERRERVAGREFWVGHLGGQAVVAVLSGIGKVAAATTATLAIQRFGAQALLFTGVAGGLGKGVRVGDLVVATELLQHDMDASPIFPRHELPLYGLSRLRTDAAMSRRLLQAARSVAADAARVLGSDARAAFGIATPAVHDGLIISGDRFVSTSAESAALRRELPDALAVEMEGAAVAQVCHDHGLPLAVLRTISDRADDQAHVDFSAFVQHVARSYTVALVERYLAISA